MTMSGASTPADVAELKTRLFSLVAVERHDKMENSAPTGTIIGYDWLTGEALKLTGS
jgi:hypothetical protein